MTLGIQKSLPYGFDEALVRVPEALRTEGFGVLTEIDVQRTLAAKLGVDVRRYTILGACNPPFAHRALGLSLEAGLLMPCNVVVYEGDDGRAVLLAVDPAKQVAALGQPELDQMAAELRGKLERALDRAAG